MTSITQPARYFDFRSTQQSNRLKGLLRMMADYRLPYIGAVVALAISASAKTATFLLLRYFVDNVMTEAIATGELSRALMNTLILIVKQLDEWLYRTRITCPAK